MDCENNHNIEAEIATDSVIFPGEKVVLNVGGRVFITTKATLQNVPNSKLSELSEDDESYDKDKNEFFFDRNPNAFDSILDLYRLGELHLPPCMCGPLVKQELLFWGLDETKVAPCCWRTIQLHEEDTVKRKLVDDILKTRRTNASTETFSCMKCRKWATKMWLFLEDPTSSCMARVWGLLFLGVVLTNVALQSMFTHEYFRYKLETPRRNASVDDSQKILLYITTEPYAPLVLLEQITLYIFLIELIVRFLLCPTKLQFFKSFFNIIDIICVLPMLAIFIIELTVPNYIENKTVFNAIFVLTILGVFRTLRLIKFARHFTGMKIMLLALKSSLREILLLGMLVIIGMLIFATLIYFAEFEEDNDFTNIPIGYWWAIVTMTTVGYGDKHPKTGWGYVVGALCALTGMLSTGLPIPIIANNFNMYYSYAKEKQQLTDYVNKRKSIRKKSQKTNLSHSTIECCFKKKRALSFNPVTNNAFCPDSEEAYPTIHLSHSTCVTNRSTNKQGRISFRDKSQPHTCVQSNNSLSTGDTSTVTPSVALENTSYSERL